VDVVAILENSDSFSEIHYIPTLFCMETTVNLLGQYVLSDSYVVVPLKRCLRVAKSIVSVMETMFK
jgi:hypothetical protein